MIHNVMVRFFLKQTGQIMKRITLAVCACLACIIVLNVSGCKKQNELPDPFFERWKKLAIESRGYSPESAQETIDVEQPSNVQEIMPEPKKEKVEKPLPTVVTTLDVHDTEIRAVLQALARAAKQNILVNSNIKGLVTVRFIKIPWNEAFIALLKSNGLTYTWEGTVLRIVSIEDMKRQLAVEEVKAKIEAQDVAIKKLEPLATRIIKVKYADIEELKQSLLALTGSAATSSGKETSTSSSDSKTNIFADKHTNSLILMAHPQEMKMLTSVVATLDHPAKQVYLKAHIVETTKTTGRQLGMQWGGQWGEKLPGSAGRRISIGNPIGAGGAPLFGSGSKEMMKGDTPGEATGFFSNFPFAGIVGPGIGNKGLGLHFLVGKVGGKILEAQLTALQNKGKLNIISSPSLTTMDNQMAFTENGAKIPYVTQDDGEKTVEFEDAVLRLEMTPHVIDETYIKMKVLVKKDEVDFSARLKVDGNPTIFKKETSTNLIVRNNETIVISGLTKQSVTESTSGVPWLADIPGLGWLFKGESKDNDMEEILIFITPSILPTPSYDSAKKIAGPSLPATPSSQAQQAPANQ